MYSDDFWECKWQIIEVLGNFYLVSGRHLSRWGAAAACIDNKLYLYGGRGSDSRARNSLYVLELENNSIQMLRSIYFPSSGREGHTMVSHKNTLIIFGGCEGGKDDDESFDDLLIVDVENKLCSKPVTTGKKPKGREGHAAGVIKNYMIIYGGKGEGCLYDDIFAFNLSSLEWKELEQQGNIPGYRESMSSAVIQESLYIFGGNTSKNTEVDEYTNDLYAITMKGQIAHCKKIITNGPQPPKRLSHSMSQMNNLFLVLFGGESYGKALNDVWVFNIEIKYWREVLPTGQIKSRMTHVCYVHKESLLVFGGMGDDKIALSELVLLHFGKNRKNSLQNESAVKAQVANVDLEATAGVNANNRNDSLFYCYKCNHDSNSCHFFERYPEVGTPVFGFFARVQIAPHAVTSLMNMFQDPFAAIMRIGEIINSSPIHVNFIDKGAMNGSIYCKYRSPPMKFDLSFLPLNDEDEDLEIRTKMLSEWQSNISDTVQIIEIYGKHEFSPEELTKFCSGHGVNTLVPALMRLSEIGLVIGKNDEFTSAFLMHKGEYFMPLYITILDCDKNIIFPSKEIANANLQNIISHSHMKDLNDIFNRSNGTYIYIYSKELEIVSNDIKYQGNSFGSLLSRARDTKYVLLKTPVEHEETNRMTLNSMPNYISFKLESSVFSFLVYYKKKLIYWEFKKGEKKKRARDECIEVKIKDKGLINSITGFLDWNFRSLNVLCDVVPVNKKKFEE